LKWIISANNISLILIKKAMRTFTSIISVFTLLLLSYSCMGPQGNDGLDGRDGIANVGATIYDVEPSGWSGNLDGFKTTLKVPELNQKIHQNGAVLVYMIKNEGTADQSFNQLPYRIHGF
jgi:hypothetical protein